MSIKCLMSDAVIDNTHPLFKMIIDNPEIFMSYYRVSQNTLKKLAELLQTPDFAELAQNFDAAPKSLEQWLLSMFEQNPGLQLLLQLFDGYRMFRSVECVDHLFSLLFSAKLDELTFSKARPLFNLIHRHYKVSNSQTVPTKRAEQAKWSRDKNQYRVLATAVELLLDLQKHRQLTGDIHWLTEALDVLVGSDDMLWLRSFLESLHLSHDKGLLLRWLNGVMDIERTIDITGQQRFVQLEHMTFTLLKELRLTLVQYPKLFDQAIDDVKLLVGYSGAYHGHVYMDHYRYMCRADCIEAYRRISLHLSEHSRYAGLNWFKHCRRLVRLEVPFDRVEYYVEQFITQHRQIERLFNLADSKVVSCAQTLENWWSQALTLNKQISPFAANQWLKWVAALTKKFGEQNTQWLFSQGMTLVKNKEEGAASLYYFFCRHFLPLKTLPQGDFFEQVQAQCQLWLRNIDWMRSSLWLLHHRREHLGLFERWQEITSQLNLLYPSKPYIGQWKLWDKSVAEVERSLSLWQKFITHGYQSFADNISDKDHPVAGRIKQAIAKEPLSRQFWQQLLDNIEPNQPLFGELSEVDHPLLGALKTPEIVEQCQDILNMPLRVKFEAIDALTEVKVQPNLHELYYLVKQVLASPRGWYMLTQDLSKALHRSHLAQLKQLLVQLDSIDSAFSSAEKVRLSVANTDCLTQIMCGDRYTTSCTDGPDGSLADFSIVHGLHHEAFKLLVSFPTPKQGMKKPQAFISVPCFRFTQADGQVALLLDSIDAGGLLYHIEDGVNAVASVLTDYLGQMASRSGMGFYCNPHFYNAASNTLGQQILAAMTAKLAMKKVTVSGYICTKQLYQIGVRQFYSELNKQTGNSPIQRTRLKPKCFSYEVYQVFS